MIDIAKPRARLRGAVALAALLAFGAAGATQAGECPEDQRRPDARAAVSHPARGVTDTVLAAIDLSKEPASIANRMFRLRRLVIEPGGVVPWHSHGDRPALIYVVEGSIVEYASNCAVPITHSAGEVAAERAGVSHWWQNHGNRRVVLLSADLLRDPHDHNM